MTLEMDPILPVDGAPSPRPADAGTVVAMLRKLIIDGHYPAGARLAEIPVATALGVSRTPVRLAFRTLEQEGLLQPAGKRGVVVRAFSERDVHVAVEVRGVLEGLAARHLAERGVNAEVRATLQRCIDEGRELLAAGVLTQDGVVAWSRLNSVFHRTIVGAIDSPVVADAIARNDHLPFASADSIVIDAQALDREFEKLRFAQMQHQLVFDALVRGESARVEMLMREHAFVGLRYGPLFGLEMRV